MVKVEAATVLTFEEIKTRLRELQNLVDQLKSDAVVQSKSLEKIQQERLFLQQQLIILKAELEQTREQNVLEVVEPRVIN